MSGRSNQKRFAKHVFYLDIDDPVKLPTLELEIQALGGIVERCFSINITHLVVTKVKNDFSQFMNIIPRATHFNPALTLPQPNSNYLPFNQTQELIKKAEANGIKVWELERLQESIKKYLKAPLLAQDRKYMKKARVSKSDLQSRGYTPIKSPCIMVQDCEEQYRPILKEFHHGKGRPSYPMLNFDAPPHASPYFPPEHFEEKKHPKIKEIQFIEKEKRLKERQKFSSLSEQEKVDFARKMGPMNGYCEPCRMEFNDIREHFKSAIHQKFANNPKNFEQIDTLIQQTSFNEQYSSDILDFIYTEPEVSSPPPRESYPPTHIYSLIDAPQKNNIINLDSYSDDDQSPVASAKDVLAISNLIHPCSSPPPRACKRSTIFDLLDEDDVNSSSSYDMPSKRHHSDNSMTRRISSAPDLLIRDSKMDIQSVLY